MHTKAVFFDAGNTLLRVHPSVGAVYARVTGRFGARVDPAAIERELFAVWERFLAGRPGGPESLTTSEQAERGMWRHLLVPLHRRFCPRIDFEPWFEALHAEFGSPGAFAPYPETSRVLDALKARGLVVGVISNWDSRLLRILDGLGLSRRLDFALVSALEGVRKPARELFVRALARAGARPEEALHAGDSIAEDVAGARAAGIRPVFVARGGMSAPPGVPAVRDLDGVLDLVETD